VKRILCSLLVATLPLDGVVANAPKSNNAKVTLVYHELPNARGKSVKGILVEYGPGAATTRRPPLSGKSRLSRLRQAFEFGFPGMNGAAETRRRITTKVRHG
jgi:hypothetical protein